MFGGESGRDVIQRSLLTRKAYERLLDIAQGKPVPEMSQAEQPAQGEAETESAEAVTVEAGTAEAATTEVTAQEPDGSAESGEEPSSPKVPVPTTPETT